MCQPGATVDSTEEDLENAVEEELESADDSDSDSGDSSIDSDSSSDTHSDEDSGDISTLDSESVAANAQPSGSQEKEEDEAEIVTAFKKAQEINRNHPPDILLEDFITDITFHPKTNILAASTIVGDVMLYTYCNESTECTDTLEVHTKACRDIEISLDGSVLYSASKDKSFILSDLPSGKMKRVTENAHDDPLYKLLVIDENRIATGDENGVVKVWDMRQKDALFSVKEMDDYVSHMITNDSKRYLVCSSGEGCLTTLNLINQRLHVQSEMYEAELTSMGLIRHDKKLLVSSSKGRIYIFNWGDFGYHTDEVPGPKQAINCMIPITENIVVTGCEDGKLRAANFFPHQQLGIVGQHNFPVEQMDISGDGEFLASTSHDQNIKFWNIKYFEDIVKVNDRDKVNKRKVLQHNLPSSRVTNVSDFFADLGEDDSS